jgi:hypothetical protein
MLQAACGVPGDCLTILATSIHSEPIFMNLALANAGSRA